MKSKLNIRQIKFIDNLFLGMSLVKAYREAGYKGRGKSDYSDSSRLLRKANVLAELKARIEAHRETVSARLMTITDGATNAYIRILKLKAGNNPALIEIQRKVAQDLFDRAGLQPVVKVALGGDKELEPLKVIIEKEG